MLFKVSQCSVSVLCCFVLVTRSGARFSAVSARIDITRCYGAEDMSQGGSRRPYSRGGPRWHPRYKDYWDYEQNYRYLYLHTLNVCSCEPSTFKCHVPSNWRLNVQGCLSYVTNALWCYQWAWKLHVCQH